MIDRVRPDSSIPLTDTNGNEWLLDHRYDFVRVFPWLNFGVVNVVAEGGIQRLYVDEEQARMIADRAMIGLVEMDYIGEQEHEIYLDMTANNIESWFSE